MMVYEHRLNLLVQKSFSTVIGRRSILATSDVGFHVVILNGMKYMFCGHQPH